jgi:hypothetical protein
LSNLNVIFACESPQRKIFYQTGVENTEGSFNLKARPIKPNKYWLHRTVEFEGIEGLYKTLKGTETARSAENYAVMRGQWKPQADLEIMEAERAEAVAARFAVGQDVPLSAQDSYFVKVEKGGKTHYRKLRRKNILIDAPLDWVSFDFDGLDLEGIEPFDVANPQVWVDKAIAQELGPEFQYITYVLQLSASAGVKPGLSAHVWFMLAAPMDQHMWKAWMARRAAQLGRLPKIDKSLFERERIHYVAAPHFEGSAVDPVKAAGASRWVLVEGMDDRVTILDLAELAEQAAVSREHAASVDANRIEDDDERAKEAFSRPGVVGAFNRCFSISETINRFLHEHYRIETSSGRVTWINSPSGNAQGCRITAGNTRMFSTHSNDPLNNKVGHAFDHIQAILFEDDFISAAEWAKAIPEVAVEMERAELSVFDDEAPSQVFETVIQVEETPLEDQPLVEIAAKPSKPKIETPDDIMAEYPMPLKWYGAEASYRMFDGQWFYGYVDNGDDDEEGSKKKKKFKKLWTPITIVREFVSVESGGITIELKLRNRSGQPSITNLLRKELGGQKADVIGTLAEQGWLFSTRADTAFVNYIRETASKNVVPALDNRGWDGRTERFASPGGNILGQDAKDGAILRPDLVLPPKCASAGTLDGWKAAIKKALTYDICAHWPLSIAAGLVGPLVPLLTMPTSGLAMCGETSRGKSTGLALAVSAWSDPRPEAHKDGGMFVPLKSTMTSFDALAKNANHTILALDETALMKAQDLETLVFSVTSGVGKARTKVSGDGLRASVSWQTFVLMTGEQSIAQRFEDSTGKRMAKGAGARIVDINIDGIAPKVNDVTGIKEFEMGLKNNYGLAGPAFVQGLFDAGYNERAGELALRHSNHSRRISNDEGGLNSRAASVLAALLVAAELAEEFELVEKGFVASVNAAIGRFWTVLADEQASSGDILADLRLWVATRLGNTILAVGEAARARETVAWYDEDTIYVPIQNISSISKGSMRASAILKKLEDAGITKEGADADPRWIKGVGRVHHVKVCPKALGITLPRSEFDSEVSAEKI